MRECLKCGGTIPWLTLIDGKTRHLQRRKYCLKCSPFGEHAGQKLRIIKPKPSKVIPSVHCVQCGKFYFYNRKSGGTLTRCAVCINKEARAKMKQRCILEKGGKCQICGYDKCAKALVFHHVSPKEKEFQISNFLTKNWDSIKRELNKCLLLCANCHVEEHERLEIEARTNRSLGDNDKVQVLT